MSVPNEHKIDFIFLSRIRQAIATMRRAGINETLIGCIVTEIRSAAINGEFERLQELIRLNPPQHVPHGYMAEQVKDVATDDLL